MKFKLNESTEQIEMYEGWAQEDIDLFESIDWGENPDDDYDAGFAYLDSATLYDVDEIIHIETEFHKFFTPDPFKKPYYKPVEMHPFETNLEYLGPVMGGDTHKDYDVYNVYNSFNMQHMSDL